MALEEDTQPTPTTYEVERVEVQEPLSADIRFSVKKRRPKTTSFTLGGQFVNADGQLESDDHVYVFTQPKTAVMMAPLIDHTTKDMDVALTKSTFDWLGAGLSPEDNERILNRLYDSNDDLDSDDLMGVVQRLGEYLAERPTK